MASIYLVYDVNICNLLSLQSIYILSNDALLSKFALIRTSTCFHNIHVCATHAGISPCTTHRLGATCSVFYRPFVSILCAVAGPYGRR